MNKFILIVLLSVCYVTTQAATGDTIKIVSHPNVIMTTDTFGSGALEKKRWAVFPNTSTAYRKVFVRMSYKCPAGLMCGEWDYVDALKLRRTGGVDGEDNMIELVRFITPYGSTFNNSWGFTWYSDITDFSTLLHDSCEIGYYHSGYETHVGRGWDVTIEFNFIEGTPARVPLKLTKLWNGGYSYGNVNNPIENYLQPITFTSLAQSDLAVIRIHQTGHGSDDNYCSEFCYRSRFLKWDGNQIDQTLLWRKCGFNALYPQGGTWIYDRGNWCPGALVYPYRKYLFTGGNESHTLDIDMQSYISTSPSAHEEIASYLIEYKNGIQQNDVAIDEILRPTINSEYLRINPVCDNPLVIVQNMGANEITSLEFEFGFNGQNAFTYNWIGTLPIRGIDTIMLPQVIVADVASQLFKVTIKKVNNNTDPYMADNTATSRGNIPLGISANEKVYLELKTNNYPGENSYKLYDSNGNVLYQRAQGSMSANTVYKDTFDLPIGCYTFIFKDINDYGGDGLSWWANSAQGSGYARLRKVQGNLMFKNFGGDFGADARASFTVGNVVSSTPQVPTYTAFNLFPNPADQIIYADVMFSDITDYTIIITDVLGRTVSSSEYRASVGTTHSISTNGMQTGYYMMYVISREQTRCKSFIISH